MIAADAEPKDELSDVVIRPSGKDDKAFIASTWVASYSTLSGVPVRKAYTRGQSQLVDHLIADTRVVIACPADMPSYVIGWASGESDYLHFAYVRNDYRNRGIARRLITYLLNGYPNCISVTHRVKPPRSTERSRFVYNPYPLLLKGNE